VRFYLDLKTEVEGAPDDKISDAQSRVARRIAGSPRDWVRVTGDDFEQLINEMVRQLPADDAHVFLGTVKYGFRSRVLSSGVTISFVSVPLDERYYSVHVRIRAFAVEERQAELPTIGLELADLLLATLPEYEWAGMVIWQDRGRIEVLNGDLKKNRSWREVLEENPVARVLAVISLSLAVVLLTLAIIESTTGSQWSVLGGNAVEWFGRLIGPVSSTFVASAAALVFDYRSTRQPRALWRIGQESSRGARR
jgi:hypothetical protein